MRHGVLLAVSLVALLRGARAEVRYSVDVRDRASHRAQVTMQVDGAPSPLELSMPVWTPGAYELRTWGRNVRPMTAQADGRTLSFDRLGPSRFRITGHRAGATVRLEYQVYAHQLSDDGSNLSGHHALINGSSMFLRLEEQARVPHRVHLEVPSKWRVACALAMTKGGDLVAPSYEALIDAPIEIAPFVSAEVMRDGRTYRVVIDGVKEVPAGLPRDLAALAETEAQLVGAPPYQRYLLILHVADGVGRTAALEHAASTSVLVTRRALSSSEAYGELLYVVAHELFHAWNARRLRPAELCPYDLAHAVPSRSLWITEGLTEYYALRALHLSGLWTRERYLERLGDEAGRAVLAAKRSGLTLEEQAELAWQAPDEAVADPDAYYARGHLVALALDAAIREATTGVRSLDDVLRDLLMQADRAGGVLALDGAQLARSIRGVAGDAPAAYVADWTREPDEPPRLARVLARMGLTLQIDEEPARPTAGMVTSAEELVLAIEPGGPAELAGVRVGDRILSSSSLARGEVGARIPLEILRAGRALSLVLELAQERASRTHLVESPVPLKVAALRSAWLP